MTDAKPARDDKGHFKPKAEAKPEQKAAPKQEQKPKPVEREKPIKGTFVRLQSGIPAVYFADVSDEQILVKTRDANNQFKTVAKDSVRHAPVYKGGR